MNNNKKEAKKMVKKPKLLCIDTTTLQVVDVFEADMTNKDMRFVMRVYFNDYIEYRKDPENKECPKWFKGHEGFAKAWPNVSFAQAMSLEGGGILQTDSYQDLFEKEEA
jgi:hypothetical protein